MYPRNGCCHELAAAFTWKTFPLEPVQDWHLNVSSDTAPKETLIVMMTCLAAWRDVADEKDILVCSRGAGRYRQ
jgi:hypothetical protein